jgi:hypothetical protein
MIFKSKVMSIYLNMFGNLVDLLPRRNFNKRPALLMMLCAYRESVLIKWADAIKGNFILLKLLY